MSIKRATFRLASNGIKTGIKLLCQRRGNVVAASLAEELPPVVSVETDLGVLHFFCPGRLPLWRAETLLTKEPETIEWISSFERGDVFWDIGANVGVYSLYAALKPDVAVLSFEPAAVNYYVLNRNVEANKMDGRISAYCLAFNDVSCLDYLFMSGTEIGGALHSFGQAEGSHYQASRPSNKQAMFGFSVDDFVQRFSPPFPTHLKIDVDGIEDRIVRGAEKTIADERLKSVLIELDVNERDYCRTVIQMLEKAGLRLGVRRHGPMFETGQFSTVYNHIFVRS